MLDKTNAFGRLQKVEGNTCLSQILIEYYNLKSVLIIFRIVSSEKGFCFIKSRNKSSLA